MIRPAISSDATGIAEAHVLSWQGAYRGLLPDEVLDSLDVEARAESWRRRLDADDRQQNTIVADEAGRIIGFAHLCPCRDADEDASEVGEVAAIYVRPDRWGTGVGRQLSERAVDTLTTDGYSSAVLWVLQGNERAIGFYEASGWTADGAMKADTVAGTPVTELRYRRGLH